MNSITFKSDNQKITVMVDFNKPIIETLKMVNIEITGIIISKLNNRVVDSSKSFKANDIKNNDVLEIGV